MILISTTVFYYSTYLPEKDIFVRFVSLTNKWNEHLHSVRLLLHILRSGLLLCVSIDHPSTNKKSSVAGLILVMKNEIENCTILISKGNSYCRRKSSARGPRFKVSSKGLSAESDILLQSPIHVQTKADFAYPQQI